MREKPLGKRAVLDRERASASAECEAKWRKSLDRLGMSAVARIWL